MDTTSPSATYVYGIAPAEPFRNGNPPLGVTGIGGRGNPVRTIMLDDLAAVVSDVPGVDIDLKHENLLDHQRVLDEVLRRADVLPLSFGTVAESDDEVREVLLREGYYALCEQLTYVQGCVELQVKALWDQERLFVEIADENEEVRALRDQVVLHPNDTDSIAKINLGQLTEAEIELKSQWEAEGLLSILEPRAVDVLVSPNLNEIMLLNAAFLVERAREAEFDDVMNQIACAQSGRLIFRYVGPLPPYSFINLVFEAEG